MDFKAAFVLILVNLFALMSGTHPDLTPNAYPPTKTRVLSDVVFFFTSVALFLHGWHLLSTGYDFLEHAGFGLGDLPQNRSSGKLALLSVLFPVFVLIYSAFFSLIGGLALLGDLMRRLK